MRGVGAFGNGAAEHREAAVLVPAINMSEAGLAQPGELHFEGRRAVLDHEVARLGDFFLTRLKLLNLGQP